MTDFPAAPSIEDLTAIAAVISRLSLAIDQQEWDQASAALAEEVTSDYVCLFGGEPETQSRDGLVAGWRGALPGFHAIQHMVCTAEVELIGPDLARARSNVRATHRYEAALWVVGGLYHHELVRTPGGWRISRIRFTLAYEEGDRGLIGLAAARAQTLV